MAVAPPSDSESDASGNGKARPDVTTVHATTSADDQAPVAFPATDADIASEPTVAFTHEELKTSFTGVRHRVSTPDAEVHQFRGIKYATFPMRFRRSVLFDEYDGSVDATKFG